MKKWYLFSLLCVVAAFVLELLPGGAVLKFGKPDGTFFIETYSYFSMTPFGYANFGPLPAALLSAVILVGVFILLLSKAPTSRLSLGMLACCIAALFFSLLPFGSTYITVIAISISALLFLTGVFLLIAWNILRDKE